MTSRCFRRPVSERRNRENMPSSIYRPDGWRKDALEMYLSRDYTLREIARMFDITDDVTHGVNRMLFIIQREALLVLLEQRHADNLSDLEELRQ